VLTLLNIRALAACFGLEAGSLSVEVLPDFILFDSTARWGRSL